MEICQVAKFTKAFIYGLFGQQTTVDRDNFMGSELAKTDFTMFINLKTNALSIAKRGGGNRFKEKVYCITYPGIRTTLEKVE